MRAVVLVIDIQNDFLHENGAFAERFGVEDIEPMRKMVRERLIPFLKKIRGKI